MNFLIVGMQNVGKTSLYNIITESNNNLIHKTMGTTRDWHVSALKNNININVYDTPGIIITKNNLINKTLLNLIEIIDVFIYVVSFKNENYHNDYDLLKILRKYNKEIILIINKDDNYKQNKNLDIFGIKNYFYISCAHKIGFDEFINHLNKYQTKEKNIKKINHTIGLFGKTNVGKSTLLNKLVGFERSLVSNFPKTTTDIVSSSYNFKNQEYLIKDTAGLIKKNKIDKDSLDFYATKQTLSIIKDIDINIFLIDVQQGFDNQSKKIFKIIYEKSNVLLFLINKIDLIKKNKKKILNDIKKNIEFEFSQSKNIYILPISTKNKKDIILLKKYINKLILQVNKSISTSQINLWLKKTINEKPHPRIKGREVKFKYATQISDRPFTIKIFSNFSKEILNQYRRFLLNTFNENFKIKSKKIKIIFSKSANPYN